MPIDRPWTMATLGERIEHALVARGMIMRDLDREIRARCGIKGTGYAHRWIKKGEQPGADRLAAIVDILQVSERWLLSGRGPMDPDVTGEVPTYDSLEGWAKAAEIEVENGRLQEYVIRAAGRAPAFVTPAQITPDFVYQVATFWLAHAPIEHRIAAGDREKERIKGLEDARRKS